MATLTTGGTSVSAIVTAVSVPHAATGSHVIAFVAGDSDAMVAAASAPDCRATFQPGEDGPWDWVAGQPKVVIDADETDEPTAVVLCLLNATDESVPCEHNAAHDAAKVCLAIRVDTLVARGSSRRWPALVG